MVSACCCRQWMSEWQQRVSSTGLVDLILYEYTDPFYRKPPPKSFTLYLARI